MPTSMNTGRLSSAKGTSMRFRGKWSENSEYQNSQEYIDLTESDGSLWICEKTNSGVKPVEGEYWALAAQGVSEESLSSINTKIEENRAEIGKINNQLTQFYIVNETKIRVIADTVITLSNLSAHEILAGKEILGILPRCITAYSSDDFIPAMWYDNNSRIVRFSTTVSQDYSFEFIVIYR